ncbi:Hcp family type VI secretion system effector [Knoellia sp. CPCC 206450]|uniref:Hcp family type VI secretion system effector n=1 Tax=Knoellia tibetensis TaxID=3404798 RepID=UPI003B432644
MSTSIFVRIDSIKGESRERGHEDEIEAVSWSWGVAQATGAGAAGRGAGRVGRPTFSDFTFVHHVDAATPLLLKACATGQHLPKARVTVRKAGHGQHDFLVIELTEVSVSSVFTSIGAEADAGDEVVVLSFAGVDLEYVPQGADGRPEPGIRFTHDLRTR